MIINIFKFKKKLKKFIVFWKVVTVFSENNIYWKMTDEEEVFLTVIYDLVKVNKKIF